MPDVLAQRFIKLTKLIIYYRDVDVPKYDDIKLGDYQLFESITKVKYLLISFKPT